MSTATDQTSILAPARLTRRATLGLGGLLAAPALAQPRFPDRPIRLVFPWPSGGSADAQIRGMCETAGRVLGQPIVIDSRPGVAGTLGPQQVAAQARPDGYTLTIMHHTVMRWPFMTRTPRWHPVDDFTHIIGLAGWLFGTVVKADSRFGTWQQVVEEARANPEKLTFGATGAGSSPHLTMVEIQEKLGIQLTHVPYRGGAEAMTATLGGHVDMVSDSAAWAPFIDSGEMRALHVWSPERSPRFPAVPTLKDLGVDLVSVAPYGISGPKGMDPAIAARLHEAFKEGLFEPANAAIRARFDLQLAYFDPAGYTRYVTEQTARERALVQRLGISVDG
ncbi:tripartite tricarboxylate transporter substrate binding protein [Siccirubricoccus sp. G192]|uniref:Bug family tripartite tricarboxylate transporter substrate binding protein n=1 Tax=Siccirubricoccus sp. G192 TaxID=2849651 RepID=UPI001C2BBFF4|nr:tripartite tricarboxylate transporter substrate binding protein [Siccirubricoccus sp. G192]MBV1795896.1 tripartite tricarboxylate transporter substrate binding protein [Siccirubricoccus sp. G192]